MILIRLMSHYYYNSNDDKLDRELVELMADLYNECNTLCAKGTIDKYKATDGWEDFVSIGESTAQKCKSCYYLMLSYFF